MSATTLSAPIVEKKLRFRRQPLLPLTLDERLDIEKRELRVPATLDEYFALVQDVDYSIHYRQGHIISFVEFDEQTERPMGQAAPLHERLMLLIGHLISTVLNIPKSEYQGYGSNIKIYVEGAVSAYNPDIAFTKGDAIVKKIIPKGRKLSTKVLTNSCILVEILSKSTKNFDLNEKWLDYQKIESLQQMIFVEQESINVKTYIRQIDNSWLPIELKDIKDELSIFEHPETIPLSDIYPANALKR